MAYNPNKAADVAALKTELNTDPVTMGYDLTKLKQAANLINNPDDNASPATVQRGWPDIQMWEILDDGIIDETEYNALSALDKEKVDAAIDQPPETPLENYRLMFRNSFTAGSTTYTNLVALRTVDGSRADVLWGYGSNVTNKDMRIALDS